MRIATETLFRHFLGQMGARQAEVLDLQQQISSGRRLDRAADDPIAAARVLDLEQSLGRLEQHRRNIDFARARLGDEEAALAAAGDVLQRVRELAVSAANLGAHSADSFVALRAELETHVAQLFQIANRRDAQGRYLFAGFSAAVRPFDGPPDAAVYNGDQGRPEVEIAPGRRVAVADPGFAVFGSIREGNGVFRVGADAANAGTGRIVDGGLVDPAVYLPHDFRIVFTAADRYDLIDDTTGTVLASGAVYTPGAPIVFNGVGVVIDGAPAIGDTFTVRAARGRDVFGMVQELVDLLGAPPVDEAARVRFVQTVDGVLQNLDQAIGRLLEVRTDLGARLVALDQAEAENEAVQAAFTTELGRLRDTDLPEAISRLQWALTTLDAAQRSFVAIERLSLFDHLR
ncbi:MAG: flagellar hook-associated protein FlgL [Gammaproteobacteria bacterium]|nr:MAG: flagellar hook-associated protein FlgL [Gammaproteobacteria bacterium]